MFLERIELEAPGLHPSPPVPDQMEDLHQVETVMHIRIVSQIRLCEVEEGDRRTKPVLLQMDKRPGQLDQALVEGVIGSGFPASQPEFLQDIVGLEEPLAIEAFEVPRVVRITPGIPDPLQQRGNLRGFLAHPGNVRSPDSKLKA